MKDPIVVRLADRRVFVDFCPGAGIDEILKFMWELSIRAKVEAVVNGVTIVMDGRAGK